MFYADYNSTAPVHPEVFRAMEPFLREQFGNPSNPYSLGVLAKNCVDHARGEVAALVNADPEEIIFVSGGTEANFSALVGAVLALGRPAELVSSQVEHPSVLGTLESLKQEPFRCGVNLLEVNRDATLDLDKLAAQITSNTRILSFMLANNETGVIFPVAEIVERFAETGVVIHTDAVQAVGKIETDFSKLGVSLLSLSAHKIGGPKGIGALVVRRDAVWKPLIVGGGQQQGRRGGTLPVAQIIGFGAAAKLARTQLAEKHTFSEARDAFEEEVLRTVPRAMINCATSPRLPNTSNLSLPGVSAISLVENLNRRGIMISSGAACSVERHEPSHVLRALGKSRMSCLESIRVSFAPTATASEGRELAGSLREEIAQFRELARATVEQATVRDEDNNSFVEKQIGNDR